MDRPLNTVEMDLARLRKKIDELIHLHAEGKLTLVQSYSLQLLLFGSVDKFKHLTEFLKQKKG